VRSEHYWKISTCYLLHVDFFRSLIFDPEDGGDIFLQNASWLSTAQTALYPDCNVLWHVDQLLRNDCEINDYTTAVIRQRPVNSNRETVFSVRSVQRCYKQDKLGVCWWEVHVRERLGFSRYELLLWVAGNRSRGQFENSQEGERLPLEAVTKQQLGRAVAQAVIRWLPTAAARVRVRAACGVCGGQIGTGAGFLRVLRFPLPIIPPISPSS
jgi:hypothetical protein